MDILEFLLTPAIIQVVIGLPMLVILLFEIYKNTPRRSADALRQAEGEQEEYDSYYAPNSPNVHYYCD